MLSIVIPTYRQLPRLRLALRSVLGACAAEHVAAEVIVVDDADEGEAEGLVSELAGQFSHPLVAVCSCRAGRSGARNVGARRARGERLLFLDGDVLVTAGTLSAHAALSGRPLLSRGGILRMPWLIPFQDPAAGVLTDHARSALGQLESDCELRGRTVKLDTSGYLANEVGRSARANKFERDIQGWLGASQARGRWLGVTGAHFSIDRGDFERLGGFDEVMGRRWGAEDLEFGFRAEVAGLPIVHLSGANVCHMDHDTSGRDGDHELALRYFANKHQRPGVLRLLAYFAGECPFSEVAQA